MTALPPAVPEREWWTRPGLMFPLLVGLLIVVAVLVPEPANNATLDRRLSAHLAGPLGARGLKDVAARLGWQVSLRDSTPVPTTPPGTTVHAVLGASVPLTPAHAHRYLEAVRGGDALLLVVSERTPLSDSLTVRRTEHGASLVTPPADTAGCGARRSDFSPTIFQGGKVRLYALRWPRGRPAGARAFATVHAGEAGSLLVRDGNDEATVGFPYGKGRIVVVSDPDVLRNDVIRRCEWGADVHAVRLLEWLSDGGTTRRHQLAFDEFHQGYGPSPSPLGVAIRFVRTHPVGRMILALTAAALLLLVAAAPRAVMPRPRSRTERRDPLEQVGALANAYRQVGASRTATLLLLGGVRSRVERAGGTGRQRDDEAFLSGVEASMPALAADVALVRRALGARDDTSLSDIGAALRRIERSFTTTIGTHA